MAPVGQEINEGSTSGVNVPGVTFLFDELPLLDGVLYAFSAFIRSQNPIHVQIWRAVDLANKEYALLSNTIVEPSRLNAREDVS